MKSVRSVVKIGYWNHGSLVSRDQSHIVPFALARAAGLRRLRRMRGALLKTARGGETHFRWRGTEISRIENLSDAVFGFAITLLVVSASVPATYGELKEMLRLFVPFGVCMLAVGMIWHAHYTFFRRYGLQDTVVMLINGALLFVVVFFLYPLKFLVTMLFNLATGRGGVVAASRPDGDSLLGIYSAGYAGIFLLFAAFYWHAWRKRDELALTPVEQLVTKQTMALMLVHVISAVLALNAAIFVRTTGMAGLIYFLIGPLSYGVGVHYGRQILTLTSPPQPQPVSAAIPANGDRQGDETPGLGT